MRERKRRRRNDLGRTKRFFREVQSTLTPSDPNPSAQLTHLISLIESIRAKTKELETIWEKRRVRVEFFVDLKHFEIQSREVRRRRPQLDKNLRFESSIYHRDVRTDSSSGDPDISHWQLPSIRTRETKKEKKSFSIRSRRTSKIANDICRRVDQGKRNRRRVSSI